MNKPRPICDGFADINGDEFLIEIYSVDEELVEEFCVSRLLEDGSTVSYEPTDAEGELFLDRANEIYDGHLGPLDDYCDF